MSLLKTIAAPIVALAILVAPATAQETRIFVDDAGHEVEIPVHPQRIVSLRGEQFTAPLIELAAPIVGSTGRTNGAINDGEPFPRGAYDLFGTTFGENLAWMGLPTDPDFEAVAAVEPDLIILPDFSADLWEPLSRIAPTVVIGVWSNPMLERYGKIADAAGMYDVFEARKALYDQKLAAARKVVESTLGDPSSIKVAIAEVFDGELYIYRDYAAMSQVLRDLGFSMPEIIAGIEGGNDTISPELLPEINADFLIGTYSATFDEMPPRRIEAWEDLVANWDDVLHAPQHNQHIFMDREPMRALSFTSLETTLAILLSHLTTRDFVPLGEAN